jgi:hypothetical protein
VIIVDAATDPFGNVTTAPPTSIVPPSGPIGLVSLVDAAVPDEVLDDDLSELHAPVESAAIIARGRKRREVILVA